MQILIEKAFALSENVENALVKERFLAACRWLRLAYLRAINRFSEVIDDACLCLIALQVAASGLVMVRFRNMNRKAQLEVVKMILMGTICDWADV